MTAVPALQLQNVRKSFRRRTALHSVDLQLERGETVGFVGPNGAGKSTCLRILTGMTFRDGGDAQVCGLDPGRQGVEVRRRCAYLPGETSLYDALTGRQLLALAQHGYPQPDPGLAESLTGRFGLPLDHPTRQLSAGMKQQLALAAVLSTGAEVFLLDEPDRNLDPTARAVLRDAIRSLQERGRTILFSSHHLAALELSAQRTEFLLGGRVVPAARVERARTALRNSVRLRLRRPVELPDGARITPEPDGSLRARPADAALDWVRRLPADAVETLEVGATRLEDLYAELQADPENHQ